MQDLLVETRRQLGKLDRFAVAMIELRLVRWLLVLAVLTSAAWVTGTLMLLLDMLPDWALMPVAMPLLLSIGLDLASAPFRKAASRLRRA